MLRETYHDSHGSKSSEKRPNTLRASDNVAMFSWLIVRHARGTWDDSVNFIISVAALSSSDVELAVGISRGTVMNFVARIAMFVGAFVAFCLITNFARVGT